MKIRLGYVAISLTLDITASKTITYTNYHKLNEEIGNIKLDQLITENFKNLKEIFWYNYRNKIHFYRISHNIIPLATHNDVVFDYIEPYKKEWEQLGKLTKLYDLRVDTHPDQFCVLNSTKSDVIKKSIEMLEFHQKMFEAMKIDGKTVLHVGGAFGDKEKAIKKFINTFKKLDKKIQDLIILENDDKIFNVKDILYICETLKIPMVLDYHHYKCNNEGEDINDYLSRIIKTWEKQKLKPKMHFSSPKNKREFRSHSTYINANDFIDFLEILKKQQHDVDIMLECKAKDEALFRLVRELKYKTNYRFIDDTTIEIK